MLIPLILFIYIDFIFCLLYLQFFARTFSHAVGDVRFTGHYAALPLTGDLRVRDLTVSYNGLDLRFDNSDSGNSPVDAPVSLRVEHWKSLSDGGEVVFQKNLRLRILRSEGDPSSFTVTPVQVPASATAVWKIPFRLSGEPRPTEGRTPVLSWERDGKTFYMSLPEGSRVDTGASVLLARTDDASGAPDMHLSTATESQTNAYAFWLSQEASLPTEEAYRSAVAGFLDSAWRGWSVARLSADGTLWTAQDGRTAFREETAMAFVTESLARGSYPWARNVLTVGWNAWRARSPAETPESTGSVFLGNLGDFQKRAQARDPGELARLSSLLKSSDPALFAFPRLIPYLLDHASFNLVQETLAFLRERASSTAPLSIERTVGVLEACLDAAQYVDGALQAKGVADRLLSSVRGTDLGIFLVQEGETERVDLLLSLRASALLLRAGDSWDLPILRSIGRGLAVSALGLQGENGHLPAALVVSTKNARVTAREGSLAPETAYPHVAYDRYVPRETPLSRTFEPGVWIWSAARPVSVENTGSEARFTLSFPAGNAHFLMIQGLKAFRGLRLHDTPWNPDPAFGQYTDGWTYDASTLTLFVKLTHVKEREEIRILY